MNPILKNLSAAFTADGLVLKSLDKPELEVQPSLSALNEADLKAFVAALLRELMARFKTNDPKA